MERARMHRINLSNFQNVSRQEPSPVDTPEQLNVAHNRLEAHFREARDISNGGVRVATEAVNVVHHNERLRATNMASNSFIQGSSNQPLGGPVAALPPPLRVPESVRSVPAQLRAYGMDRERRRVSSTGHTGREMDIVRQLKLPQHQPQQLQLQQLEQHHIARRQSSPSTHQLQHHHPQVPSHNQNYAQQPVHPEVAQIASHPHAQMQARSHTYPVESNMLHAILERLELIADRQETAQDQRAALFQRLGEVENALGTFGSGAAAVGKRKANTVDAEVLPENEVHEKSRNVADAGNENGTELHNRTFRCLTLLAQRVGDIARTVNGIEDTLGIADSINIKDVPLMRKGKMRSSASPDDATNASRGADIPGHREGSSAETGIDVDALDLDEVVPEVRPEPDSEPGLQGWQSSDVAQRLLGYNPGRHSGSRTNHRSIMERLDSQESILMDVAEWLENMQDPHADMSTETRESTQLEGGEKEVGRNQDQATLSSHQPLVASPLGRVHKHDMVTSLAPQSVRLQTPRTAPLFSGGGSIEIHINDPPPISSTSKATHGSNGIFVTADELMIMDDKAPSDDSLESRTQAQGPAVRLYATGNAGVRLLDLARSIAQGKNVGRAMGIGSHEAEDVRDNMNMDVFESRPNVHGSGAKAAKEIQQRSDSAKTLVYDPVTISTTTLEEMMGDGPSSHSASLPNSSRTIPTNGAPNIHKQTHPLPTIKIKVTPRHGNSTSAKASSSKSISDTHTISPSKSATTVYSLASPSTSATHPNIAPSISPSKFTTPKTLTDHGTKTFGFSPVDWTRATPGTGTKALPFDLAQLPTSPNPTHSVRILRSSSRRASLPISASPSNALRSLHTPKRLTTSSLVITPTQPAEANRAFRLRTEVKAPEVKTAERAIEGLLNAQAHTPQRAYTLDTSLTDVSNPTTPLTIRIPSRVSQSSIVLQKSTDMIPGPLKQEEGVAMKQVAERALTGILEAQAVSPHKSYTIDASIIPQVEETELPQTSSPHPHSVVSQDGPSTPATPKQAYTLPGQPEGSVSALRHQALGHPFVYAGVGLESSTIDSKTTELEEDCAIVISPLEMEMQVAPDDRMTDAVGKDQSQAPADNASENMDNQMEDVLPQPECFVSKHSSDSDDHMTDEPTHGLTNGSASNQPSPKITQLSLDTPSKTIPDLPVTTISTVLAVENQPNLDQVNDTLLTLAEAVHSRAHSSNSALTPLPESEARLSPLTSRSCSVLPSATSPSAVASRSLSPIPDLNAVTFRQAKRQRTSSILTTPTNAPNKPPAEMIASPPSVDASRSSTEVGVKDQAPVAITSSQATCTTDDEDNVQNFVLGYTPSSPFAAIHEPDVDAFNNAPKTPPQRYSPMIASSYSPEDMNIIHHDGDDGLEESGNGMTPIHSSGVAKVQFEAEATSSVTPPIHSPPKAIEPKSTTDEDALEPGTVLQVKQELDNLPASRLWAAGTNPMSSQMPESGSNSNNDNTVVPGYIYISDTDATPEKRPAQNKDQKKRALSVISISSDEGDNLSQKRTGGKLAQVTETNRSAATGAGDIVRLAELHTPKVEIFDDLIGTSTPLRDRSPEVAQFFPNQRPDERTSPAPAAETSLDIFTKELSPVSDLSRSPTPQQQAPEQHENNEQPDTIPAESPLAKAGGSSFDLKKYVAKLDSEDDALVVPTKKRNVPGKTEAATEDGYIRASDRNTPAETLAPQKKGLLVVPKKGKSAAITRVKKRKGPPQGLDSDDEDLRPLKKANLRKSSKENEEKAKDHETKENRKTREQPERSPSKKIKAEQMRTPTRPTRIQQARAVIVKWPTVNKPNFDQFIRCDLCKTWYHLGCVGVGPNDPRLDDSQRYTCPPCEAGVSSHDSESPSKHANFDDPQINSCSRPKCQRPRKTKKKKAAPEEETFIVESFIGRHRKSVGGMGLLTFYLVKWHGYPHEECTWEELNGMGLANSAVLVDTFEKAARDEDIDLVTFTDENLLLQEAVDAGWRDRQV